jgi:rhodanese-related sulfurtransferase
MGIFNFFKRKNNMSEIQEYLAKGAVVIDVRTVAEFEDGHAPNSLNIVLDTIPDRVEEIRALGDSIIAVCRSGARSGNATQFLNDNGLDVINGGPWQNLI